MIPVAHDPSRTRNSKANYAARKREMDSDPEPRQARPEGDAPVSDPGFPFRPHTLPEQNAEIREDKDRKKVLKDQERSIKKGEPISPPDDFPKRPYVPRPPPANTNLLMPYPKKSRPVAPNDPRGMVGPETPPVQFNIYPSQAQQPVPPYPPYPYYPEPTLIKQNIYMAGPSGSHDLMERVYEDILPQNDLAFHHCTIAGRVFIRDHVRHTLIRLHDGEDVSVNNGKNSLLQYMKFMELNPTGSSMLSRNPYFSLPNNLLIYRSCYPIRVDERTNTIGCAKESSSLNIRIYALSIAEFMSKKLRQRIYMEYDVWRELAWYHYLLESVIKPKVSPHFVAMMSHFMCMDRQIDFDRLNHNRRPTQSTQLTLEVSDTILATTLYSQTVAAKLNQPIYPSVTVDLAGEVMGKHPEEIDPSLQCYSGNSLIIATEAPHQNLYQWASQKYEVKGRIRKMIQQGFHSNEMWRNVLFQIMHSLYTMQVHGLYLYQMSIEDNVQIREVENSGKFSGYWQYVINGLTYYLPNEGYLVMIDSSYKDIPPQDPVVTCGKRIYKIQTGGAIGPSGPSGINGVEGTIAEAREGVFQNYRKIISTNAFGRERTVTNDLVIPHEPIMRMIEAMMKDPERELSKVIATHFRMFLHNRIGTYLDTATEVPNIRTASDPFRRGEMAILVINSDTYKWCLVLGGGKSTIQVMTKNNPRDADLVTQNVQIRNLRKYSQSATLMQSSNDYDFSEEKLLETYVINSR